MSVYIAYRDLADYYFQMNLCGGPPINPDFRLATVRKDIYLLTCGGKDYAITRERAEQFRDEVISKTTGSHNGFFPMEPELNGKKTAAVIEISEGSRTTWYDFDDELILQMLIDLKNELGNPLDQRGLINHCYPNPVLPDDYELMTIYHQIYCGPDNTPAAVVRTMFPDTEASSFQAIGSDISVVIREGLNENKYRVPDSLIPDIKEKVRELCKDPAEAYVEPGSREGFIQFGKAKERIFTDPDKTLELLKYIASGSELESTSQIDTNRYYPFNSPPANPFGFAGMMGIMMNNTTVQQPSIANADQASEKTFEWKCPMCGAVNAGKFCMECGSPAPGC